MKKLQLILETKVSEKIAEELKEKGISFNGSDKIYIGKYKFKFKEALLKND